MHSQIDRYLINNTGINFLLYVSICLMIIVSMFYRFLYPDNGYIAFFHDDFYYYLKIAENIYNYGASSFNNIVLTNGYHPLWMLVLVGLLSVFKGSNIYFFLAVSLVICLSNIFIFLIINKIFKHFINNTTVTVVLSGYLTSFALIISKGGMEVHITILMMCYLIYYILKNIDNVENKVVIFKIGLLSSILFLSRLDSAILVCISFAALILFKRKSIMDSIQRSLAFSAGGIMMPIYLISNNILFGTFIPVSGQAKQLKSSIWPSTQFVVSTMKFSVKVYEGLIFLLPAIVITIIAFILIIMRYKHFYKIKGINILIIAIVFPLIFMTMQSLISDWPPWLWYYYPLITSSMAAIIVIYIYIAQIKNFKINQSTVSVLLALLLMLSFYSAYKRNISADPMANSIYSSSVKIAEKFANATEDVFAMGDRAGIVGYLLKNPVIHLEGIVMDRKFLQFIKKEENLLNVLKTYNVNYYIATNPEPISNGCYEFVEPRKAGNDSRKMRAVLCQEPFYEFWTGNYHTAIFKILK